MENLIGSKKKIIETSKIENIWVKITIIQNHKRKEIKVIIAKVRNHYGKVIKNEDGDIVCHRYYIQRTCNSNCKLKNLHKKLLNQKMSELYEFV